MCQSGTEMSGGVANVLFESNRIDYAGIALKLSTPEPRGGNVTNSTWRDIDIDSAGMAIGIDGAPPFGRDERHAVGAQRGERPDADESEKRGDNQAPSRAGGEGDRSRPDPHRRVRRRPHAHSSIARTISVSF